MKPLQSARTSHLLLAAILSLALTLRLWGIQDRLPDPSLGIDPIQDSVVDETDRREMAIAWEMWRGGIKPLDLNPHAAEWPALSVYGTLSLQILYRIVFAVRTGGFSAEAFAADVQAHPDHIFLFARAGSALLLGVGTVLLTFLLGRRLLGQSIGLLAALLVATNSFHILTSQHVSDPNLWALLFSLAASIYLIEICDGGGVRASVSAGAMIGFAAASKYVPVILTLPYALAHAATINLRAGVGRLARSPAFLTGLVALIVAFLIASPFTVIDWKTTKADLSVQQERHASDWTGMSKYPIALPTYMFETLPQTLGWPLYLLSVVGLGLMFRRGGSAAVVASVPVVYVLANGALSVAQPRFILPAMGVVAAGGALAMTEGGALAAKVLPWRFAERGAVAALAAVSLIAPAKELTSARRELALPDSRHEARAWITRNIEPSAPLAIDGYGPAFNTTRIERLVVDWPFYASEPELVAGAYDPIWLDGFAYYVTSSEVVRRFASAPGKYRRENAFYAWMGTRTLLVWWSDPVRQSGPRVVVRRLPLGISSQAERDSAWAARVESGKNTERLAQWCLRAGALFYFKREFARAEEWGKRGMTIQTSSTRRDLLSLIVVAESGQDQPEKVIETARSALKAYPDDAEFHMFLGAALQRLGRNGEAVVEYEASLRLDPKQPDAQRLMAEIARMTGSGP